MLSRYFKMTEPAITPELVAKHNLTPEEYAHAREILGGREPSAEYESECRGYSSVHSVWTIAA